MAFVFGSFVLNGNPTIKQFGVGLAVAVILDATVVRCLLVPSVMLLMGKINWYMPGWLERLVPRISIEGADFFETTDRNRRAPGEGAPAAAGADANGRFRLADGREDPQHVRPEPRSCLAGSDRADSGAPSALLLATDLAVGATSQATRLALQVGATGWNASVSAGRLVSALPGANGAGRLLNTATRPLVDSGRETRTRARSVAQARMQSLLETVVPGLVDAARHRPARPRASRSTTLVQRIDIDQLVRRIEIDDLVQRIDIDQLVGASTSTSSSGASRSTTSCSASTSTSSSVASTSTSSSGGSRSTTS